MVGHPGLGKTHIATGLALAACRQGYPVRFYTAAGLVNDLIAAQDERLSGALLDRLTHKAHILEFIGESYRFRQRLRRTSVQDDQGPEPKEWQRVAPFSIINWLYYRLTKTSADPSRFEAPRPTG